MSPFVRDNDMRFAVGNAAGAGRIVAERHLSTILGKPSSLRFHSGTAPLSATSLPDRSALRRWSEVWSGGNIQLD